MGRCVGPSRPSADDADPGVGELVAQLPSHLHAVGGRQTRSHDRYPLHVFRGQLPLHIEHCRRIIDLLEERRILRFGKSQHRHPGLLDPAQFAYQIHFRLPTGDAGGHWTTDAGHPFQLALRGPEHCRGIASKIIKQMAGANRADARNKVQGHKGLNSFHWEDTSSFSQLIRCTAPLSFRLGAPLRFRMGPIACSIRNRRCFTESPFLNLPTASTKERCPPAKPLRPASTKSVGSMARLRPT